MSEELEEAQEMQRPSTHERIIRLEESQKAQDSDIKELKASTGRIWEALDRLSVDVAGIAGQMKLQTKIMLAVGLALITWLLTKV